VRQQAGIAVECVWITSAFKALINLQAIQPDILIADLSMSNVDGYDLLRTVRANHKPDALVLVGLTATDPAEVAALGNLPADIALVQKPVNTDWFQGYFASQIALRKLSV
jgi:CheY-like chemotaxis protein